MQTITVNNVYEAMIKEKLSLVRAAKVFGTPASTLYYHLRKFCKENALELPKQPRGRKSTVKFFRKNENTSELSV